MPIHKDCIYFLDSTMHRIWVLNENINDEIEIYLESDSVLNGNGIFYSKLSEFNQIES